MTALCEEVKHQIEELIKCLIILGMMGMLHIRSYTRAAVPDYTDAPSPIGTLKKA
jgi:hypothetical protein